MVAGRRLISGVVREGFPEEVTCELRLCGEVSVWPRVLAKAFQTAGIASARALRQDQVWHFKNQLRFCGWSEGREREWDP